MFISSVPTDRRYLKSHEWAKLDGDTVTVGITDHAQTELGDIVFADLPDLGAAASAGETVVTVESVKTAADIYAPVSGEVVAINDKLEGSPELINEQPHDDGWMFQLKVSDPAEFEAMLEAGAYEKSIEDAG